MISIIVPVYNSDKYLNNCLESIHRQQYQDWECILIDDGSTDEGGAICDSWCKFDSRMRVFHQPNSGVSVARNNGIKYAFGEHIVFIDSDDWIDENYLSILYANRGTCDLIVSGYIDHYESGQIIASKPCKSEFIDISRTYVYIITDLLRKNLLYGPTNKLYKSEIIRKHNITFPDDCFLGEDLVFNFNYLDHIVSIETISEAHYNYRRLQFGSLSTKVHQNQFQTDYQHWKLRYNFFEKKDLLTDESMGALMKLLWGLIYDGVFRYETLGYPSIKYLKFLNDISETNLLLKYTHVFSCTHWIKQAIVKKRYVLLYLFFNYRRLKNWFISFK